MANVIYTFGGGDTLHFIFQGVATLVGTHVAGGILGKISITIGLLVAIFLASIKNDILYAVKWFCWFLFAMTLLFLPKTKIVVIDVVLNKPHAVENVPWVLGFTASKISMLSHYLTIQFESIFNDVENFSYHKTGTVFASKLMSEANSIKIHNSDIKENFNNYASQCILYDIAQGYKYSLEDLRKTDNIWKLLKDNASQARSFVYRDIETKESSIITCRDGITRLDKYWKDIIDSAAIKWGLRHYQGLNNDQAKEALLINLKAAQSYLTGYAGKAEDLIQQKLMSNIIRDGFLNNATKVDAASVVQNFTAERAYEQQKATYIAYGKLAERTMVHMKTLFEALIYGAFPLVMVLSLISAMGYRSLLTYGGLILWVQSWPIFYAILNFIMLINAKSQSASALYQTGAHALSWSVSGDLSAANEEIAAQAGYLAMSIPFISYAIVKGGAASFVHLASHLGSVASSAATTAASEAVTGNYSFGNVNSGNVNYANTGAFKHNTDISAQSGSVSTRTSDGMQITTFSGEREVYNTQHSQSQLVDSINMSDSTVSVFSEQEAHSRQLAKNDLQTYNTSKREYEQNVLSLAESVMQTVNSNEGIRDQFSADELKSYNTFVSGTNSLSAAQFANNSGESRFGVDSYRDASVGIKALGTGASTGIRGSISGSTQAAHGENYNEASAYVQSEEFRNTMNTVSQMVHDKGFQHSDSNNSSLSNNITQSYEKMAESQKSEQINLQNARSFQKMASLSKQQSVSINQTGSQFHVERLSAQVASGKMTQSQMNEQLNSSDPMVRKKSWDDTEKIFNSNMGTYMKNNPLASFKGTASEYHREVMRASQNAPKLSMSHNLHERAHEKGIHGAKDSSSFERKIQNTNRTISGKIDEGRDRVGQKDKRLQKEVDEQIDANTFVKAGLRTIQYGGKKPKK